MQKTVYLDHNATTPIKPEVLEIVYETLGIVGNPSSIHKAGRDSRRRIEAAREQIARLVNAGDKAVIVFTSGATEANNLVLKGSGCERALVSAIEHVSTLESAPHKEIIPVLPSGVVDLAMLDRMLEKTDRSTLVSVLYINNETGVIQPIDEVVRIARTHSALVHVDAAQAAGRIPIDTQSLGIDYLTLSSHKMGGPQGAGCVVMENCLTVTPLLTGGNQEKNMRAGTENLPGISGFGKAAELAVRDMNAYSLLTVYRDKIEINLKEIHPSLKVFGEDSSRAPNTSMIAAPGLPSDMQLISLDLAGIYVSNGSACSSGTVKRSHVLKAMGASDAEMASALRISMGWNTTEDDVNYFIQKWQEMYERVQLRLK
jgi:cysteine desulfurase